MNSVEIPIVVSGLGAIKAELKALKGEIANATDPADIARLSQEAGVLKDKISDANEAVNVFATGSKFEQVSNGLGGIKDSLMSLDFEEASTKAKTLAMTMSKLNPKEILGGMGQFVTMLGTLGSAFVKLGLQILTNPLFLLVVTIVAIVAAVGFFLDKIGVLGAVLDFLMIPINAVIDALKWLGDALGLTSYAEDEAAANAKKNSEATLAEIKKETEARDRSFQRRKQVYTDSDDAMGRQIKLMKAQGKDTTDLERARLKAAISYQTGLTNETFAIQQQLKAKNELTVAELRASALATGDYTAWNKFEKEMAATMAANAKANAAANTARLNSINDLAVFEQELINDKKKAADDEAKEAAKDREKANNESKAANATNVADRLASSRKIRDGEIRIMAEGLEKEEAIIMEKFKREREDIASNTKLKAKEKITLTEQADKEEAAQLEAKRIAVKDLEKKNMIAVEGELAQLRLDAMAEGAEKELIIQNEKYKKLRDAANADTRLTQEQLKEKLDLYNTMQIQEETARMKDKVKAASDLLTELTTTEEEKRLAELEAKYVKDQEMAMGNQKALEILEANHKKALADINTEAQLKQIAEDQKTRDAKLAFAKDTVDGLTGLGNLLIKDQKKLEKFNKASALIQIGIDTAKAISALVANSQANPMNSLTAGAAGIAQFATGIIQIATNVAKAKQILTSPGATPSGGGGGGGGDTGGGTSAATALPQSAQLFGSANTGGSFSAGGGSSSSSMTVTAVVSETQVTSVQDKINRINKSAEL
jgi:hypothetical protein